MRDQEYYDLAAAGLAIAVVVGSLIGLGLLPSGGRGASPVPAPSGSGGTAYMYLTVQINPQNGMPQYSPANFTIPTGEVRFEIIDYDAPATWTGCTCQVTGTVGGTEEVNGTSYAVVPDQNVAHTFSIPALGLNVLSPGRSTVTFTWNVTQGGSFTWYCESPCGSNGSTGAPMGVPGYMSGTVDVA